jgi:hypothetical protein
MAHHSPHACRDTIVPSQVAGPVWFMATTAIMVGVSFLLDFVI